MTPKLSIIITHCKEEWKDCYKMFSMLEIQRGVNFDDVEIIVVQDGTQYKLSSLMIDCERFHCTIVNTESVNGNPAGVSAARNKGLSEATAPWVMFCDCDDMLYCADSLNRILTSIDQTGNRGDLLWAPIWIEYNGKHWNKVLKEWNSVFIHGKVYRRQFLIDNTISFDTELSYAEDALFNAEVAMCIKPSRIGRIPEVTYMWCQRPESLSSYTGGDAERNLNLYKMRLKRCRLYDKHNMHYEAETSAIRAALDYYWELNADKGAPAGGLRATWMERVRCILHEYPACLQHVTTDDWNKLCKAAEDEAKSKHFYREDNPQIDGWIASLQERK